MPPTARCEVSLGVFDVVRGDAKSSPGTFIPLRRVTCPSEGLVLAAEANVLVQGRVGELLVCFLVSRLTTTDVGICLNCEGVLQQQQRPASTTPTHGAHTKLRHGLVGVWPGTERNTSLDNSLGLKHKRTPSHKHTQHNRNAQHTQARQQHEPLTTDTTRPPMVLPHPTQSAQYPCQTAPAAAASHSDA